MNKNENINIKYDMFCDEADVYLFLPRHCVCSIYRSNLMFF